MDNKDQDFLAYATQMAIKGTPVVWGGVFFQNAPVAALAEHDRLVAAHESKRDNGPKLRLLKAKARLAITERS